MEQSEKNFITPRKIHFSEPKFERLRGPRPAFNKPIYLTDEEKAHIYRLESGLKIKREKIVDRHLDMSRFYLTDTSKEFTFAREQVARYAISSAVKTYSYFGARLSFPSIIYSGSGYSLIYLHRSHLFSEKFATYPYARLELFAKKTLQFDSLIRKWLNKNYRKPLGFELKTEFMEKNNNLSHGDAQVVVDKRVDELFEFLPFELVAFAAQKGATCETRRFLISLPEFPKLHMNSGDLQNLFDVVFKLDQAYPSFHGLKRTWTFRDFARFFNVYIFKYGDVNGVNGYLTDCKYVAQQLNEYESASFKAGLVDFSLNNPLVDERAKNLVRDHKNFINEAKKA